MNEDIRRRIAELEAHAQLPMSETVRLVLERELADLRRGDPLEPPASPVALVSLGENNQTGDVSLGDVASQINKPSSTIAIGDTSRVKQAIGVNYGVIQAFFGAQPPEDAAELLRVYLDMLAERYRPLVLSHLLPKERSGSERTTTPTLPLRSVYTALATNAHLPREPFELTLKELETALTAADPNLAPSDRIRLPMLKTEHLRELVAPLNGVIDPADTRPLPELWAEIKRLLPRFAGRHDPDQCFGGRWYEPELAVEALAAPHAQLVLLGDPGSGKSTVLRYLVVSIAEALLSGATTAPADLRGWEGKPLPVPIFCPLAPIAKNLSDDPGSDLDHLVSAVIYTVTGSSHSREGLRATLLKSWRLGGVLLCFDGLDEVSSTLETTRAGTMSRRERIAVALHQLNQEMGDSRVVVTCRTRPYEYDRAWQFPHPWRVRRIAPFAFGQVRFFVEHWYAQSSNIPSAAFNREESAARVDELLQAIQANAGLRAICTSPLLLTIVVLLHFNQKQLPSERAEVYEDLVELLLDRWEWVRSNERGQVRHISFSERLNLPLLRIRDLRSALNAIAFQAHRTAKDGRGVIAETQLYELLEDRFRIAIDADYPERVKRHVWTEKVELFLELLVAESGLIQPDSDGAYVLPHLTFEEYLAACHLAEQQYAGLELAYACWSEGGDRWREPLLLMMGCLRRENKHGEVKYWLDLLLDTVAGTIEKTQAQQQHDAVLAAACYTELGGRHYLRNYQHARKVDELEAQLRAALAQVLTQADPTSLLPLRIEAATTLGRLGDPRYPVDLEQWQAELGRLPQTFGSAPDYFCHLPGGDHRIGGWDEDEPSATLALRPFWLARFPITVAQYAPFAAEGYLSNAQRWWQPQAWQWLQREQRHKPLWWNDGGVANPSRPVVGVTWHEAMAYCAWLSARLRDALAPGMIIRLPSEAEWETAAAWDGTDGYRDYPWGDHAPSVDRALYNAAKLSAPAPVGCCPIGTAACGALDMAGNVWEMTLSDYHGYPRRSHQVVRDSSGDSVAWRGGSFVDSDTFLRCGIRDHTSATYSLNTLGFRVVVAEPLS